MREVGDLVERDVDHVPRIAVLAFRLVFLHRVERLAACLPDGFVDARHLLFRIGRHLRFVAAPGAELRAELVVVTVADVADVAQYEVQFVRMALRQRAGVFHHQFVAFLAETRQHQPVDVQVGDLAQHGHASLFGEYQEIGADMQPVVRDADVHQDGTVRDMELRAVGIAVICADSGFRWSSS